MKAGGCNHMKCEFSEAQICWGCLNTFTIAQEVYDHMMRVHGDVDLVAADNAFPIQLHLNALMDGFWVLEDFLRRNEEVAAADTLRLRFRVLDTERQELARVIGDHLNGGGGRRR